MSVNKATILGNVGKDPEIRTTQDGREIANLSIATSQKWKDKNSGERKEKTEWHKVVIFSPGLVNVIKNYVKKGSKLYIEGALQTRKWQGKDGSDNYSTEIVLQGFNCALQLLDSKGKQDNSNYDRPEQANADYSADEFDDEIPF